MKHLSFNLISTYALKMAHDFYLKNNLNLDELYQTCNFSYKDLRNEHNQITIETLIKSLALIKSYLAPDEKLANILEENLNISDLGGFGFTLLSAPSLIEGLELIKNAFCILEPSFDFKIEKTNSEGIEFIIENPGTFREFNDDILDLSCLMLEKYIRFFKTDFHIIKTEPFIYKINKPNKYSRSIIIEKESLPLPSIMKHPTFFNKNRDKFLKKSNYYKNIKGCVLSVNKLIRNNIYKGKKPSLKDISDQLGTTTKTLSRLLKSHDTSFQNCLDQVICEFAINLIKKGYNTKEIAYTLGFQSIAGLNYLFIKKYDQTLNQLKESLELSNEHASSSA